LADIGYINSWKTSRTTLQGLEA